jgi:hypothetical protein
MTTYKTAELSGMRLNIAVAIADGRHAPITDETIRAAGCDDLLHYWLGRESELRHPAPPGQFYDPSGTWRDGGGRIIQRERIAIAFLDGTWCAWHPNDAGKTGYYGSHTLDVAGGWEAGATGPTPLVAAMRAYVAVKLGDTVELPA